MWSRCPPARLGIATVLRRDVHAERWGLHLSCLHHGPAAHVHSVDGPPPLATLERGVGVLAVQRGGRDDGGRGGGDDDDIGVVAGRQRPLAVIEAHQPGRRLRRQAGELPGGEPAATYLVEEEREERL